MTLTASKIEMAEVCSASMVLPQTSEVHVGQEDGVERHADLEATIKSGDVPLELARWPGFTWRSEVAFSIDLATCVARELGAGIARAYGDAGPFEIFGTADLVGRGADGELVIVDRKSFDPNVTRAAQNGQLHTLALMACRAYGRNECEVAIWHELRPMDVGVIEPWDLKHLNAQLLALVESTARARAEFRKTGLVSAVPGKHCRWCAAFHNCPAQNATMTKVRAGVIGMNIEAMLPLATDEEAARAYSIVSDLKILLKRAEGALYARAKERPIPLPGGMELGARPVKGNRVINGDKAYEMIREKYGQKVADAAVAREATQTSIVAAFKAAGIAKAEPEKDALMKSLEKDGGVTRSDSTTIDVHPAQKQIA